MRRQRRRHAGFMRCSGTAELSIKGRVPLSAALIGPGEQHAAGSPGPRSDWLPLFQEREGEGGAALETASGGSDWPVRPEG